MAHSSCAPHARTNHSECACPYTQDGRKWSAPRFAMAPFCLTGMDSTLGKKSHAWNCFALPDGGAHSWFDSTGGSSRLCAPPSLARDSSGRVLCYQLSLHRHAMTVTATPLEHSWWRGATASIEIPREQTSCSCPRALGSRLGQAPETRKCSHALLGRS